MYETVMVAAERSNSASSGPEDKVGANQRRYERFAVNLRATLVRGRQVASGRVVDVSFTGLYFATYTTSPLRDLVKIDLELQNGRTMRLLGMAVHAVRPRPGQRRRPGIGIQLFGNGPETLAEWNAFVTRVRTAHAESLETGQAPSPEWVGKLSSSTPATEEAPPPTELTLPPEPDAADDEPDASDDAAPAEARAAPDPSDQSPAIVLGEPDQGGQAAPTEAVDPDGAAIESLGTENLEPVAPERLLADSEAEIDAAFERIAQPAAEHPEHEEVEISFDELGPGDVAPGPVERPGEEPFFEFARPELRVRLHAIEELAAIDARRAQGEALAFRTDVHMPEGTDLQLRVVLPDGKTAFVADGRVEAAIDEDDFTGLSVRLEPENVSPSEDIYITIDLDSDWLRDT